MAKYSIVELAVSNGNLVGVDQLSNNQKRALELNNAIYIYRGTRSKKVYIGQTMHFIERLSSITMERKKSLVLLILIK